MPADAAGPWGSDPTPPISAPDGVPPGAADAPTQRTGIISAAPVGWSAAPPPSTPPTDQPVVAWAPPAAPAARTSVGAGLVIAGVFSRLVAFFIDGFILSAITIAIGLLIGAYRDSSSTTLQFGAGLVGVAISGLYFVALWTSGWQATIGMRLIGIRVLRAADGGTLPLEAALIRWLALEGIIQLLAIVPVGQGITGLIALIWIVALLLTTATDRLRQGFHDRWAGSVVVQPAPGGSGAAVVGCLVMVALALFIPFLLVLLLSNDLQDILSRVGQSI
jgi:uncharacterized RDD family membrane protein YckC